MGKNPSMFEKRWGVEYGVALNCLATILASSMAINRPNSVTIMAAIFRMGCIVIRGVFSGRI